MTHDMPKGAIVQVTLHTDPSLFTSLQPRWNALLDVSANPLLFLTWEWQITWWQAYQAGDLWVLTAEEAGEIVGIAPWFVQHKSTGRVVRTIGCVDVTDYVDIIAHADHVAQVQQAFAAFTAAHRDDFDRINLCNIPEYSPTYQHFPDHLRALGFDADLVLQEVCPVIHLPTDWEAYLGMLDKKQRHEIRRKLRRAESEAELVRTIVTPETLADEIEVFLGLMRASQPSKAEFLAVEANDRFFRAILQRMSDGGWLRMSILRVNGKPAAAYCDFDYRGHILVYNSGLDPEYYAHLSTGIVLLAQNIQDAIETGHSLYDFLRGNESYKYRMGAQDVSIYKLVAHWVGQE